ADGQARLQALLGGQIDMERGITAQQQVMLTGSDKFDVQVIPTGNWRGLVFRTDVEPFNDVRVRKAVRLAADRDELVKLVLGGQGVVACDAPVEPNDQYRADLSCPQDIEGAKALLAEAGYPDGIDIDVHVATLEPTWPTLAVAYQEQAAAAGIRVNVVQTPTDGYWSEVWMKRTSPQLAGTNVRPIRRCMKSISPPPSGTRATSRTRPLTPCWPKPAASWISTSAKQSMSRHRHIFGKTLVR
ncbi:MAG: hypothetical protein EBT13_08660, partial [Rhodobacteraceae bacterium]|nr:hypothetical protein [Paracoccaceae bacterium]